MKHRNADSFVDFSTEAAKEVVNPPKELIARGRDFEAVSSGAKTVEMRINLPDYRLVDIGSTLIFKADGESVEVRVLAVRKYADFKQALAAENKAKFAPDQTDEDLRSAAQRQFPLAQARHYGIIVFEFEKIN